MKVAPENGVSYMLQPAEKPPLHVMADNTVSSENRAETRKEIRIHIVCMQSSFTICVVIMTGGGGLVSPCTNHYLMAVHVSNVHTTHVH